MSVSVCFRQTGQRKIDFRPIRVLFADIPTAMLKSNIIWHSYAILLDFLFIFFKTCIYSDIFSLACTHTWLSTYNSLDFERTVKFLWSWKQKKIKVYFYRTVILIN